MALVIGIAVVFFVPALFWATEIAGLIQSYETRYGRPVPSKPSWPRKRSRRVKQSA